jgi:hypothetical protein
MEFTIYGLGLKVQNYGSGIRASLWDLWFVVYRVWLRGSRPVLSCESGWVGVSVKTLRPIDRSQNFGRTKSLSYSETCRSVSKNGRTKSIIDSSIFHTKERAVNRVGFTVYGSGLRVQGQGFGVKGL